MDYSGSGMSVPIPDKLIERTADGRTVLFVGAGMSMPELPGWKALLEEMAKWCGRQGIRVDRDSIEELIAGGDLLLAHVCVSGL